MKLDIQKQDKEGIILLPARNVFFHSAEKTNKIIADFSLLV